MKTNSQKKPIITESLERDFEKTKLQLGKEAVEKMHFFKKYKQEEEDYYEKRKRRDEEKKLQEERITVEKIRQQEEENLKSHTGDIPKGKVKKNIFGKTNLKANTALPPEIRPGQGKQ